MDAVTTSPTRTVSSAGRFDVTVFIGRFQPYHNGHHAVVTEALQQSDRVIVLVGTVFEARSPRNPFTFEERRDMIMLSVPPEDRSRVFVRPIYDWTYMGNKWLIETKRVVNETVATFGLTKKPRISLIGHAKDASSYYLKLFGPDWESIDVHNYLNLDGTYIRNAYFSNIVQMWLNSTRHHDGEPPEPRDHLVTEPVHQFLEMFSKTPDYKKVRDEIEFCTGYRAQFASLPFPPVFVTVDAVVVHRGKVLLVKRSKLPGKGLWALPGGYLMVDKKFTLKQSMLKELDEETKIGVPPAILDDGILFHREFDDPYRSERGRIITHAYLIQLSNDMDQPKVRGKKRADDDEGDPDGGTEYAQWFDIAEITREMMFEDHFYIIQAMIPALDNKFTFRRK